VFMVVDVVVESDVDDDVKDCDEDP
jgi:hypothetical protein